LASESKSTAGWVIGLSLGIVLTGAIAASPLYCSFLQSDDRALDAAVAEHIETVRRALLRLDYHLAVIRDIASSGIEGANATPEQMEKAASAQELYSIELASALEQTSRLFRDVVGRDEKQRGLSPAIRTRIPPGPPNPNAAVAELQSKHLKDHDRLLEDAEKAVKELRSIARGGKSANNHLWSNQIRAVLELARAELLKNRGDLDAWHADVILDGVEARAMELAEIRGILASLAAQEPSRTLSELEKQLQTTAAGISAAERAVSSLEDQIARKTAELERAEAEAATANAAMADLLRAGLTTAKLTSYEELSRQARAAEARIAALRNGSMEGGELRFTLDETGAELPAYQGGRAEAGLRDLQSRLEELKAHQALLRESSDALAARRKELKRFGEQLQDQEATYRQQADQQAAAVREGLTQADARLQAAGKAWQEAMKIYASAGKSAATAVNAAKARVNDARQASAAAGAGVAAELLRRISSDVEPEATALCLSAECAYKAALIQARSIDALRSVAAIRSRVAKTAGLDQPVTDSAEIDKQRTEALTLTAAALRAYKDAATLVLRSSVSFPSGNISGKDYVWQVHVGQAAVHLLQAVLFADSPEEAYAQKEQAYSLLVEASKGREKSPLLSTVLDTIEYLQRTVR